MADDEFGELKKPIITSSIENNNCETALSKLKNLDIESEEDVGTGCVHYKRRAKFVVSLFMPFIIIFVLFIELVNNLQFNI